MEAGITTWGRRPEPGLRRAAAFFCFAALSGCGEHERPKAKAVCKEMLIYSVLDNAYSYVSLLCTTLTGMVNILKSYDKRK